VSQVPTQSAEVLKERYAVLLDIGHAITGELHPDELYATIHRQTARVIAVDGFCISLLDGPQGSTRCAFHATPLGVIAPKPPTVEGPVRVVLPGVALICAPGETSPFFRDVPAVSKRTTMVAPLRREDEVLGSIAVLSRAGALYDRSELELLEAIADLAAVAIRNTRVVAEVERSRMEAERLEEIGLALSSTLELPRVLERVTRAALDLTSADTATVWLLRAGDTVEVADSAGPIAPAKGTVIPVPRELYERMRMRRQPLVFDGENGELPESLRVILPDRSTMAVPLIAEDRLIGALSVGHAASRQRRYSSEDVRLLERLGFQASVAVANARLLEEVRALSLTEPLTGLANRRHLDLFLEKEFAAAQRGRKVAVLMFDLDHFKEYNDAHGHHAGDEALRAFARVLNSQTRAMNLAVRLGGDEFVIVLTDADRRAAMSQAQRIARAITADPLLGTSGLRATIGIATYRERMETGDDLLRAADADMYRRKNGQARPIWAGP
jgi:diguanylate cyclase (GGDEF)-like protein